VPGLLDRSVRDSGNAGNQCLYHMSSPSSGCCGKELMLSSLIAQMDTQFETDRPGISGSLPLAAMQHARDLLAECRKDFPTASSPAYQNKT
jgi:hypothetical protein